MKRLVLMVWLALLPAVLGAEAGFADVAPIFQKHCLDCHAADDPEGKLILETYGDLMKGGESGPAVLAGKSAQSLLVKMVEGRFEKDGKQRFMPPGKREKLSTREIDLIKGWIDAGARAPADGELIARKIDVPKITPKVTPRRPVNSLAYEPKSKTLAAGRANEVEVYSAEFQNVQRRLEAPEGNVNAVAFSPDGRFVFAAGGPAGVAGEFRQWSRADGTLVRSVPAHRDSIYALAVSPDSKLLATGGYDQKIKIWDLESGAELRTLTGHNGCVYALSFRPDGKILASASGDRTVKLWDVETGGRRDTLSQPLKEQYAVAFSPDGKRLAAAGVDNRIRVWEISEEAKETTNPLLYSKFAHEGAILRLAYSLDGKLLASSAEDRTLKIWDAQSLQEKRVLETQPDWAAALSFALNDKALVAGRLDGTIAFYDSQNGSLLMPPRPEIARVEPRGIQRGTSVRVKVTGKNMAGVNGVRTGDSRVKAELLNDPVPSNVEAWVKLEAQGDIPRGSSEIVLLSPHGESTSAKIYIDDLPQVIEMAGQTPRMLDLPVTLWGVHSVMGEKDEYSFNARAGETIVFDAAAQSIGSKADVVLSLVDAKGKVLASNNRFDKSGDSLIAHTFAEAGEYRLVVSELVLAGSVDHFYRVAIGSFPFVIGTFPPLVPRGQRTDVELIGFNLPPQSRSFAVEPVGDGKTVPLKFDHGDFRWRGDLRVGVSDQALQIEKEPNDSVAGASSLQLPAIAAGRIGVNDPEDWFGFQAKAGQTWILEVAADRLGSPLDSRLEVRDADGKPLVRTLLQAMRASAVTFRGIDSSTVDCRVENWEEMDLNQYLYLQGEVVRLFRAPQGPDSGFNFYSLNGKRRNYFDTTASAHANAEPCYIVEPHPVGSKLAANGLPVFPIFFENDDDAERKLGTDSKVYFTAPKDGPYFARVTDTRGFGGDRYVYTLAIREAKPDFRITVEGISPTIAKGSGQRFAVNAERIDGFEGEIRIEISGVPNGFSVSNPITIQEGHTAAFGTIYAEPDAVTPVESTPLKLMGSAMIGGATVQHEVAGVEKLAVSESAPLYVELVPGGGGDEIVLAPGESVPATLKVRRNGHGELVTFQVDNLPHGVIVDNIGLNGVLIPKDQNEREIFLTAPKWVPETERYCYAVSNEAGRQTSRPVLIKIRKSTGRIANK